VHRLRDEREHGHGGRTLVLRLAAAARVAGPSTFPFLTSVARPAWRRLGIRLPAAAGRRRPLPTRRVSPGSGLTLRSSECRDFRILRTSSSPAVPLPCHSQRSRPVLSGQPRTTPQRPRPAPFSIVAGGNPARSGFASRGSWVRVPSSPPPTRTPCSAGVPAVPHSANRSALPVASRSTTP